MFSDFRLPPAYKSCLPSITWSKSIYRMPDNDTMDVSWNSISVFLTQRTNSRTSEIEWTPNMRSIKTGVYCHQPHVGDRSRSALQYHEEKHCACKISDQSRAAPT